MECRTATRMTPSRTTASSYWPLLVRRETAIARWRTIAMPRTHHVQRVSTLSRAQVTAKAKEGALPTPTECPRSSTPLVRTRPPSTFLRRRRRRRRNDARVLLDFSPSVRSSMTIDSLSLLMRPAKLTSSPPRHDQILSSIEFPHAKSFLTRGLHIFII